jgi:hypothetical protein
MNTETNAPNETPELASIDASTPVSCADPRHRLPEWLELAWLERYLLRQLDGPEQTWFETYVLQWPELADTLEADAALRSALASLPLSAFESASKADETTVASVVQPHLQTRRRWSRRLQPLVMVAAGFMLAALAAPLLVQETPLVIGDPTRVVYDIVRGEPAAPHVQTGDARSPYLIVEIALPPEALGLELTVGEPGKSARVLKTLPPGPEGFATALLSREVFAKVHATVLLKNGGRREVSLSLPANAKSEIR